jgi:DNA-binding NarL/FixJ family response regulator
MEPMPSTPSSGHGLVLDDHTYMRRAVSACLTEAGVDEVLEVETVSGARERIAERGAPRIAVVDLRLSDGSGLELVPDLKQLGSRVVVFTSADDAYSVRSAYAAGAAGYVLKSADHDVMLEAIRTVLDDRVHVDQAVAGLLVTGVQVAPHGGAKLLTPREIEVLKHAADGLSNNQIAERLGVTPLAVKGHFVRIGRKLGANDRTQMVVAAMRADLLR